MRIITTDQTLLGDYSITNLDKEVSAASVDQQIAAVPLRVILERDAHYALKPTYFCPSDKRANPGLDQNVVYALGRDLADSERPGWLGVPPANFTGDEHLFGVFINHDGLRLTFASHAKHRLYDYKFSVGANSPDVKITFVTMTGERYIYEEMSAGRHSVPQRFLFFSGGCNRICRITEPVTKDPTGPRRELCFRSDTDSYGVTHLLVKDYR